MKTTRSIQLLAILALGVLGAATAGVVAHASSQPKTTINVTEREYSIKLSARKAPVGVVHFVIRNSGKYAHALSVKSGSLDEADAADQARKDRNADRQPEEGIGVAPRPVPGHAALGMKATLAVGTAVTRRPTTTADTTTTTYNPPPVPGY